MKLVQRSLADLVPYERNSRTHSPAQMALLVASLREFGFTNPVLIDDQDRVIAGHGRLLAASALGMVEVPCVVLSHLTDAQRRACIPRTINSPNAPDGTANYSRWNSVRCATTALSLP